MNLTHFFHESRADLFILAELTFNRSRGLPGRKTFPDHFTLKNTYRVRHTTNALRWC